MNWSAAEVAEVPSGLATVTWTVPAGAAGLTAVICVGELTVKPPAGRSPNRTAVAAEKPVPVRTTDVPPAVLPAPGASAVTVGTPTTV